MLNTAETIARALDGVAHEDPAERLEELFTRAGKTAGWRFLWETGEDMRINVVAVQWVDCNTLECLARVEGRKGTVYLDGVEAHFDARYLMRWALEEWEDLSWPMRANPLLCLPVTEGSQP